MSCYGTLILIKHLQAALKGVDLRVHLVHAALVVVIAYPYRID